MIFPRIHTPLLEKDTYPNPNATPNSSPNSKSNSISDPNHNSISNTSSKSNLTPKSNPKIIGNMSHLILKGRHKN